MCSCPENVRDPDGFNSGSLCQAQQKGRDFLCGNFLCSPLDSGFSNLFIFFFWRLCEVGGKKKR